MADLESVLQDVSYLMAVERSKSGAKVSVGKKLTLPDPSIHGVVDKFLLRNALRNCKAIYNERLGRHFLMQFVKGPNREIDFLKQIEVYENTMDNRRRSELSRKIYDGFVMPDLLANESPLERDVIRVINEKLTAKEFHLNLFDSVKEELYTEADSGIFREFLYSPQYVKYCQWKYLEITLPFTINPDDFTIHRIIGRGGFGEVYGCRKDDSGRMFAMKCLDKRRIKLRHGEDLVYNERNILVQVNSAFIVNLHYAFQTNNKLYLIIDLMNGGDLHYHLNQQGVVSEDVARFYGAEIILGLEHLHKLNIVYRDLKPSNILLDEEGHVRISDLGLAQDFSKRWPSSSVGTHGYMAPEVIMKGVQYNYTADWFSLGCVLHKLLLGHSPFRGANQKREDIDAITLTKEVSLPDTLSAPTRDLLHGLLEKDPKKRLACHGRGSQELKEIDFFKLINWQDAMNKKLKPPFVPPKGEVHAAETFDIGSFDDDDIKGVKLTDEDQERYKDFNTIVSPMWQTEMFDTVFDMVNNEREKVDRKEAIKYSKAGVRPYTAMENKECLLEGYTHRLTVAASLLSFWQRRYVKLYSGRLEWGDSPFNMHKNNGLVTFDAAILVTETCMKNSKCIQIHPVGSKKDSTFKFDSVVEHEIWYETLRQAVHDSVELMQNGPKSIRKISTDEGLVAARSRQLRHTRSVPAPSFPED